ncbi:tetratricopeptide repeat protein 1 [Pyxicephalus adspersus]|uniref:Tetratricopeptide repeat protein 1 n=1 Tax=Pyxicephalus adspersus TaxID=30357 RepID=A0AAV3AGP3_PYXAD|nr:TPA: hypothetical protein GDO54_006504 [Pyxicephalus adspersus]
MENPERNCPGTEEEDFQDCTEEPERPNGESEEEEFTVLETEEQAGESSVENPVYMEKRSPEPDKMKPEPLTGEEGEPDTEEKGAVMAEEGDAEPIKMTDEENVEMDEEALQEIEKDMSQDEREDRRKESTHLKEEGNELFKKADYVEAEDLYSQALQKCPAFYKKDRSILYSNRAAARIKQDKTDLALTDCTKAIDLNPDYVRALLRRAELYERTEKLDEALADYKSVMNIDASCHQAREACMRLPKQIEERNEKMKEEMISKLKSLGDLVLKPFGLSTNNFQVNQDPGTGSYSINFVQNQNNR